MIKINDRLFIGDEQDCVTGNESMAVVHACKHPCHAGAVGYSGSLPTDHPNYLVLESENDLFLNMIDPPIPLFKPETFAAFLSFTKRKAAAGKTILIHCNKGESRSPSLALLFLAKVDRSISDKSYSSAKKDFKRIFSKYRPGAGIKTYLTKNWESIKAE